MYSFYLHKNPHRFSMRVLSTYLTLYSNNLNTSDSLYRIFPLIRINGILPVSRQSCNVRLLMCNIWQTSLFVRYFSPFRCGVRFFKACPMVSNSSSRAVKNEAISFDFPSIISISVFCLITHIIAQRR